MSKSIDIIIPARYASSRFPGKSLTLIDGKPMIQRVYERARQSRLASRVIVATDDERIADTVASFGGQFAMTREDHASGTDRLDEVAQRLVDTQIIVNVQGDEPLIQPQSIDKAIKPLLDDPRLEMSTIAYPLTRTADINDPQIVKVVVGLDGFALYFSRLPIPFVRDESEEDTRHLGHSGLYVYRRSCLAKIASLPPSPLEKAEKLEQLRAMENGIRIKVEVISRSSPGVDVPEDVPKIEALLTSANVVT